MFYIAIFKDRSVSHRYIKESSLKEHNSYRWHNLHKVVSSDDLERLNHRVKGALKELK